MRKTNTKGYSLVELMVVLAIIGILGTVLVTMMNTGGHLYRDANATMEAQSNARLAMSYITMRIRQNDVSDRIDAPDVPDAPDLPPVPNVTVNVKKDNVIVNTTAYPALTIIYPPDPNDLTYTKTYWIYFDSVSKKLMEQNVSTGDTSTSSSGEEIVDIEDCIIEKLDSLDSITQKVLYREIIIKVQPVNSTEYLIQKLTLRSQQSTP